MKPHKDVHFLRARGLGLQLSPGALAPPRHHTSGISGHKNTKGDLHAEGAKARFEELVETWREAWTSLARTELHRLNIWSDPDVDFQVSGMISDVSVYARDMLCSYSYWCAGCRIESSTPRADNRFPPHDLDLLRQDYS